MKVKKINVITSLLTLSMFFVMPSFAQSKRVIKLNEAIELSLSNSNELKNSRARIEEATASLREAIERRLPEASVTGSHLRLNSPNVSLKIKPTNGGATQESGGDVSSATYGMANVSFPIYSGLRIKYGIESSRFLEKAAELDAENDREEVVLNTINAFDNLYKAKAAVDVVNESLAAARERVKQFTNLEKNGVLARNDLLKAELQASNIELNLLDAENNWKLSQISMNLMLGLPENTELSPDITGLQATTSLKAVDDYVQLGLQNRKDVAAVALRKRAASTGIKAAKGEAYPGIALTGGYVAANVPNLLTVTNAINLGVGVHYNLSNLWKNNTKLEQARAREKQVSANEAILFDAVRLQVNQSYQNYLLNQKKIDVYSKAVLQAEENYKIVKNKYNNALANTTDLLDAEIAQLQARLNFAFSKSDAYVAYSKLLQTAGLLSGQTNNK